MGLKSHLATDPFGQRALECFHAGEAMPELTFREVQRLKEADFHGTVQLLFPTWMQRAFLNVYAALAARDGLSPEQLWKAYLLRHRAALAAVIYGWPVALIAGVAAASWFGGTAWGLGTGLVAVLIFATLTMTDAFIREPANSCSPPPSL